MDVREKLVELLRDVQYLGGLEEKIADQLIANGVTVQEWIPVTERVPDNSATVNLCTRSKIVGTGFYNKYTKSWVQYYSGGAICVDVTHWQPMPQPPKGETIYCKDCEHLMFSDCYGECANGHKGIVNPNDTCEHAKRKPPKGE